MLMDGNWQYLYGFSYMDNYMGTGKRTDITSYVNTGKFSVLQYLQRSMYLLEELIKIILAD